MLDGSERIKPIDFGDLLSFTPAPNDGHFHVFQ